jgi:hypothetical protein
MKYLQKTLEDALSIGQSYIGQNYIYIKNTSSSQIYFIINIAYILREENLKLAI